MELVHAENGGLACTGSVKEDDTCKDLHCPLDCHWMPWTEWGECTDTCGAGMRRQAREKTSAQFGGLECDGNATKTESCNEQLCPVDCSWEEWTPWTNCTKSCDAGVSTRSRASKMETFGGAPCLGRSLESVACNTQGCVRDCRWGEWGKWTTCSMSCDGGSARRFRDVLVTQRNGGTPCSGPEVEDGDCNTQRCPISCIWNEWAAWSACDKTCNGGVRTRNRDKKVMDEFGGAQCPGIAAEKEQCYLQPCPIDCSFGDWSEWGDCSQSCGRGLQFRTRKRMEGRYGGKPCEGDLVGNQDCVNEADKSGCPQLPPSAAPSQEGSLRDWINGNAKDWDPNKPLDVGKAAVAKPSNGSVPCSKEALEAELKTYDTSKLTALDQGLAWIRDSKAVTAKITGELLVYADKPRPLAEHPKTVPGLQQAISEFGGIPNLDDIDIEISIHPDAGPGAEKTGNMKAMFTVYLFKDSKRTPEAILKALSVHDAKQVSQKILDKIGNGFSLNVVSLTLGATTPS